MALLLPALEQALDQLCPPGREMRLQRLELSVTLGPGGKFPHDLHDVIVAQILEQARDLVPAPGGSPGGGVAQLSREESLLQALGHYLESGNLPWKSVRDVASDMVRALGEAALADIQRCVAICAVSGGGAASVRWFRLLQLLPAERLSTVVAAIAARPGSNVAGVNLLRAFLEEGARFFAQPLFLRLAAAMVVGAVSGELFTLAETLPRAERQEGAPTAEALSRSERLEVAAMADRLSPALRRLLSAGGIFRPAGMYTANTGRSRHQDEAEAAGSPTQRLEKRRVRAPHVPPSPECPEQQTGVSSGLPDDATVGELLAPKSTDGLYPLLVSDAGLVLLSPFLARLFVQTGVLAKGESRLQPDVLPRAAALLHHLVSGGDKPYEFDAGLIKVLMGMRPELPLPVGAGLVSDQDRHEASNLLQSVVGHWQALKNTSVDGLRRTFLQRPALLRQVENGWQLQVERRPFDLLLEQLPWGFSIVKLPWMSRAIYTEW